MCTTLPWRQTSPEINVETLLSETRAVTKIRLLRDVRPPRGSLSLPLRSDIEELRGLLQGLTGGCRTKHGVRTDHHQELYGKMTHNADQKQNKSARMVQEVLPAEGMRM